MFDPPDEPAEMDRAMLGRAAAFFSGHREFLGYWLDRYRDLMALEPLALARELGGTLEGLDRLAICFTPRREQLEADVRELAERFGVEADRLADVLLAAWGGEAGLAEARGSAPGAARLAPAFAAASDRTADDEDPTPNTEHRTPNTEHPTPSTQRPMPNTEDPEDGG